MTDAALVNEIIGGATHNKQMKNEIIRNASQVALCLVIGADNSVQFAKDAKVSPDELAGFAVDRANASASASLQAVNAVRLARMLPDVVSGGELVEGKKSPVVKTPAIKYVLEKVREGCATDSTYQNITALIACADICDNNGITASPFAVKEAMGYLRKVEAIQDTPSGAKLSLAKAGAVGKALKAGTGVNKMRPVLEKAKAAKPTLFKAKTTTKTPDAPVKADDTADKLATDLKIIVSRWDKLASVSVTAVRNACGPTVAQLAKLAGLVLVEAKK